MRLLITVFRIIPKDWHTRFFLLIALYIVLGIFEMLGVASIMPFVALLSDPTSLQKSSIGQLFSAFSPVPVSQIPVHAVGLVVLFLFVIGNLLGMASMWLSIRFAAVLNVRLAGDICSGFFARGFQYLRSESPTVLANYTVREVDRAVAGGILQLCMIVSRIFQVLLVVALLAFVSVTFSAVFALVAVVLYGLFFRVLRRKMSSAGEEILAATGNATRAATELFASAGEVVVRGNLPYFIGGVRNWLSRCHKADEISRVYPMIPKYLIELVAFTMLLSLPIYRSWSGGDYRSLVPFVALFAYAGYRLLPNLQQVYGSLSILKFNTPALEFLATCLADRSSSAEAPASRLTALQKEIELRQVAYRYPGSPEDAISGVSFRIMRGEKVAIVGLSGSGKSTLLDLLLGLSIPTVGSIHVDGLDCSGKRISWDTAAVGYAPQAPLILAATVAENIAFGIAPQTINLERCREVADFALVGEVIEALPQGYSTLLGGGGVAVSGGESQRIAVARALYPSPSVIVLDEPSSALDPILSRRLLEKLCSPDLDKTVIVVTHDWDALPAFEKIVLVDQGRMIGIGSYQEVAVLVDNLRKRDAKNA